jgi:molybdopterin-guanine dinucleotide biosynthesis protein A
MPIYMSETDLNPKPDAAGFVLAGGRSSRMGEDKALVRLGPQPLVVHALDILREAGLTASLAGGSTALATFAPLIPDSQPGQGPLAGICAALASTSARLAVFLPIDLPLLPTSLIAFLIEHARNSGRPVTIPSVNGFAQTFPAVLDRVVLPELECELEAGRLGCLSALQTAAANLGSAMSVVPVEKLVQSGQAAHPEGLPAARWFLNINAPEALRLAHRYWPHPHRVS